MKKSFSLLVISIFTSSLLIAQSKNSRPAPVIEQQEIKGDNHLRKELQQKQITATPERLTDTSSKAIKDTSKENMKTDAPGYSANAARRSGERRCHKSSKPGTKKN